LEEFRTTHVAGFVDTDDMLLRAQEIHTEWFDVQTSFRNPAYTPYSNHGRVINADPVTCSEDVRILLARLHEVSPAYFWYVRVSVIVGCGPGGRVPAMDIRGGRSQSICHHALHMSQRSIWCLSNGF